jgi:integrase
MASIYKRGQTYWIQWRADGRQHNQSLKTSIKKEALVAKAAKELELSTGVSVADKNMTVEAFSVRYLLWYSKQYPERSKDYGYDFNRFILPTFGKDRLASLDQQKVSAWLHGMGDVKRSTANQRLIKLKALCNRAVEWGVIDRNPIMVVRRLPELDSKPRKFFTAEQLRAIYDADVRNAPIWQLLANTGMRISEARNLKWKNVKERKIEIISTETERTKSRKWRDIPLTANASSALTLLRGNDETYVLPRVHVKTLRYRFNNACRKSGVEGTLHELRHTFISTLVMQGIPLRTVQVLAGHSTITVTEQYSHLSPDHLADAVSGLRL